MKSQKVVAVLIGIFFTQTLLAVNPDSIYVKNIKTVRLYNAGKQLTMPVIRLNSSDRVELHFDDMDADVKYYYYTYQLCNSDWTPSNLGPFDYIKGFSQSRITAYKFSALALTRYTHYQALLPEQGMYPTRSGNYIVKVFLDGDTSRLVFTKRLLVVDAKTQIAGRVTQPYAPNLMHTSQKLQFTVDAKGLQSFNAAQQIKVVILQNFRWDIAMTDIKPAFIRGTSLEYNSENSGIFPAGKEWRWLDIRDFHLQTDRVFSADYKKNSTSIYLRPDISLANEKYVYYQDLNGLSTIETPRGISPYYEGDYATVYFSLAPPNGEPYADKNLYLFGQLTNYQFTDSVKLQYNPTNKLYETHLFLKQGYYDYTYLAADKDNPSSYSGIDGNYFETENYYTILVYYKPFIGRAEELVGMTTFDSRTDVPGLNY